MEKSEFRWRFEFMKKSLIVFGVGQQSDIISFYQKNGKKNRFVLC